MSLKHYSIDLEHRRGEARKRLAASRIIVLPYGNAWWLTGDGINCVVGELAGLMPGHLARFEAVPR
jgi:hypothetical protein